MNFESFTIYRLHIGNKKKYQKKCFWLKKSSKMHFNFFHDRNFTPFGGPRQPNFTPFQGPRQPNFTPFRGPRQPNFTPFRGPRQLLWSPPEGWGKAGAWEKVSLSKLRNTGAPSTNWGALLYCNFFYYTLYTVPCTLYTVNCTLLTVHYTL